jgi:EAL domain-containing protein (putative c-di-GMP-specific phosphodiesterase class I)
VASSASAPDALAELRFSFAFQPIVDVVERQVYSFEALVRGPGGESAATVFQQVPPVDLYAFDRRARVLAIALAARLRVPCRLNLNFLPQSLQSSPDAITSIFEAADTYQFPIERIVLEVTESEVIDDAVQLGRALNAFRAQGLTISIDDFGAGYAGLNLLADFQPDSVKLDMHLVRGIDSRGPRQAIVRAILQACVDLGIDVIAEGVETPAEYQWLLEVNVRYFQGYLFAKPGFECLPECALGLGQHASG